MFAHLNSTEWMDAVADEDYQKLESKQMGDDL